MPKKVDDFTLTRKTSLQYPCFELRNIADALSSLIKTLPTGNIQVFYVEPTSGKKFVIAKFDADIRKYLILFKTRIQLYMHFSEKECVEIKTPLEGFDVIYKFTMMKGDESGDAHYDNI